VITISKQMEPNQEGGAARVPFRGEHKWFGYPARFRLKADREVFKFTKMYLFRATDRWNNWQFKKWFLADAVTGTIVIKSDSKQAIAKFLRNTRSEWDLYRLALACRIAHSNRIGPEKWGSKPIEFSDEFNALLVVAKMEGVDHKTTLRTIHASRNTTTAPLAG
jgi:hypothetical protein